MSLLLRVFLSPIHSQETACDFIWWCGIVIMIHYLVCFTTYTYIKCCSVCVWCILCYMMADEMKGHTRAILLQRHCNENEICNIDRKGESWITFVPSYLQFARVYTVKKSSSIEESDLRTFKYSIQRVYVIKDSPHSLTMSQCKASTNQPSTFNNNRAHKLLVKNYDYCLPLHKMVWAGISSSSSPVVVSKIECTLLL